MLPDNIHTYAIGDVHGRSDLLSRMLAAISAKAKSERLAYRVVFLGDIIDRGPDSKGAMQLVTDTLRDVPGSELILGNHDWFPIRVLDVETDKKAVLAFGHWLENLGGAATVASYGFDPSTFSIDHLATEFPKAHLDVFRNAKSHVELSKHVLVHAGLLPGSALADQRPYDMMWIRDPFLLSGEPFEKTVIHGHTPTRSNHPEVFSNRIAIDTKAYETGILTAAHIQPDGRVNFLATLANDSVGAIAFEAPERYGRD